MKILGEAVRYLYTGLMYLCIPYFLVRLVWKSRRLPAYRFRIAERFALRFLPEKKIEIWIHAVSLGEVIAATPLIEAWLIKHRRVLVTTMTPTGSERVTKYFGNRVIHQYLPYDLPYALKRFFKHYSPKVGVVMETELWPNMLYCAYECKVPLVLVNGRLSQRSFRQYYYLKFWFQRLLKLFAALLVQTKTDAAHFLALGTPIEKIRVFGNIKFDMLPPQKPTEAWQQMKRQWGQDRPVVILASTHENEEEQFLSILVKLHQSMPDVMLLIAPRHPERFDKVYELSVSMGYKTGRRSQHEDISPLQTVIVLDSIGELMQAYQCSDYAFVGGSLVPVGGHNVLEPIAVNAPVFSGLHVHNFQAICDLLAEHHAIGLMGSAEAVFNGMIHLAHNADVRCRQVEAASEVLTMNQGALARYSEVVESYL